MLRKIITIWPVVLLLLLTGLHLNFAVRTQVFFSGDDFAVIGYLKNHSVWQMVTQFVIRGDLWGFRKILGYLDFFFIYNQFGPNPLAFIIHNHLLHTANTLLIYFLVLQLTKDRFKALFSGIMFNSLYLYYFSNIHEYLAVFFSLLTIWLYQKYPRKIIWSILAFILAILSKEIAITTVILLVFITLINKRSFSLMYPFLVISVAFLLYQGLFIPARLNVGSAHPYLITLPRLNRLSYYLSFSPLLLGLVIAVSRRRYPTLIILFAVLISIFPVTLLNNRRELYYLYLPLAFFALFWGLILPRLNSRAVVIYISVIIAMGGRSLLPPLARMWYPNWQLESIRQVLFRVTENIYSRPNTTRISLTGINLERDAQLMLGSGVIDQFLSTSISSRYAFTYNQSENAVLVEKTSP